MQSLIITLCAGVLLLHAPVIAEGESSPCSNVPWPNQLLCFLSYAKSVVQTTPLSTTTISMEAETTKSTKVGKEKVAESPKKLLEMAGDSNPAGNIKALFVQKQDSARRFKRQEEASSPLPSPTPIHFTGSGHSMAPTLLTKGNITHEPHFENQNSTVCFSCMASAVGEDFPNENCSQDIISIEQAVKMNIQMISCSTRCYSNVLRIGSYVTTFRGCYDPIENRRLEGTMFNHGPYKCSKLVIMGAEWWDCHCNGHFCNNKMPDV